MFLNHQTYEDLKNLVGPEATTALANRYGGETFYFPALQKEGHARGPRLENGLRFPEVRSLICRLRREGATQTAIRAALKKQWPDQPEKWVGSSSLSRFFISIRKGRMREFGIDDTFNGPDE